ncbi:hypothetical protein ACC706_37390, partial [Rhizobium johnstonii]
STRSTAGETVVETSLSKGSLAKGRCQNLGVKSSKSRSISERRLSKVERPLCGVVFFSSA